MGNRTILVTNDDGFESPGVHALCESLSRLADVTLVAPTIEKSACGHSLTLTRPLNFVEMAPHRYKLDDGTPSDCVFLALKKIFGDKKPDLVVSGINIGANMGEDITYSGTASAAMEAVLQGIPAVAVSQVYDLDSEDIPSFELASEVIFRIVGAIFDGGYPLGDREFLNINVPPCGIDGYRGTKITYAGHREYGNEAYVHYNPRGKEYYWIGLPLPGWRPRDGHSERGLLSDFEAIEDGFVSITPIELDMTAYGRLESLEKFLERVE